MKPPPDPPADEPLVPELLAEIAELRGLAAEQERAVRRAQERVNDIQRDWLYTSANNFRGTIAGFRRAKARATNWAKIGLKLTAFAVALAATPLRLVLRVVGVGRKAPVEVEPKNVRLRVGLTNALPQSVVAGRGNSLMIGGWAFHPHRRITHLEVRLVVARPRPLAGDRMDAGLKRPLIGDVPDRDVEFIDRLAPVVIRNVPNRSVLTDHFPAVEKNGNSFWSGFYAHADLPPTGRPARAQITVRAYLEGNTVETLPLGRFNIQPAMPTPPAWPELPAGDGPLVAVCMATYNPPERLFRRQVDSLREQTHKRWVCLVRDDGSKPEAVAMIRDVLGDDPRFVFRQNARNLGFYKNFEALLADVPVEADFVALCDQDDYWYRDKLATLAGHFTPAMTLVYSDMAIADETGHVLKPTYWTNRDNNHTHYPTMFLANTVTGAASMFRRSLLQYLLPFPEKFGDAYHDHWLSCVAMALGEIGYVDRPLYDYVQHGRNVIGHFAPKPGSWLGSVFRFGEFFRPTRFVVNVRKFLRHGQDFYFAHLVRIQNTARNVVARCAEETPPHKQAVLARALTMTETTGGKLWLLLRPFRRRNSWRLTVGFENVLLQAACWRSWLRFRAWWGTRLTARGILRGAAQRQLLPRPRVVEHLDGIGLIRELSDPLTLEVSNDSPARLNVVVSVIDFRIVFGGYITVFHLCRKLAERGHRVRLVVVYKCDYRPVAWADKFQSYPGLEDFLDRVELVYAYDRSTVVPVSPRDVFLATSWWTAQVAKEANRALGRDRFVYLIQEYEPGFYPYGTLAALAQETYSFRHFALFSTEILRDYFREHRLGVFAGPDGERRSGWFNNTITGVGPVTAASLQARTRRKLLFYCRPEEHAVRNMFDLGMLALRKAVASGAFAGWELHGIGTLKADQTIKLGDGVFLELLPRLDQEQYRKVLRDYDVGLSLMCSPHPSLVPMEMAGAGLVTVTNTWANKTADRLTAISSNFIPVEATVDAIAGGLVAARQAAEDMESRAAGAAVDWPTDWEDSFHPALMERLDEFIAAARANQDVDTLALRAA
jgi:glycosyltransferase involved in cell wall biosynthesis